MEFKDIVISDVEKKYQQMLSYSKNKNRKESLKKISEFSYKINLFSNRIKDENEQFNKCLNDACKFRDNRLLFEIQLHLQKKKQHLINIIGFFGILAVLSFIIINLIFGNHFLFKIVFEHYGLLIIISLICGLLSSVFLKLHSMHFQRKEKDTTKNTKSQLFYSIVNKFFVFSLYWILTFFLASFFPYNIFIIAVIIILIILIKMIKEKLVKGRFLLFSITYILLIFLVTGTGFYLNTFTFNNKSFPILVNDEFEFKISNNDSVSLYKYLGNSDEVEIPDNITIDNYNYNVTSISFSTFKDKSSLKKVIIPNSVTSIGNFAFSECSSLESITIPFVGATLNEKINTHFGYIFRAGIYYENSDYVPTTLKEVIITGGNSIGWYAFYNCSSLESIEIPNSVTSIGYLAFEDCSSLKSIFIPNSVTSIGGLAFYGCSSLAIYCEVSSKPSGWESNWNPYNRPVYWGINENNYKEENGLRYVIQDGNAILTRYVGNETATEIPSTIQMNGKTYNVTSIGGYAFDGCNSLESIVIPNGVTSIGSSVFSNCNSLTIYCEASSKPSGWNSSWNRDNRPVYWNQEYNEF